MSLLRLSARLVMTFYVPALHTWMVATFKPQTMCYHGSATLHKLESPFMFVSRDRRREDG
jgi:hypothetical protein